MYIYIYVCICIYTHTCICIYIYMYMFRIERPLLLAFSKGLDFQEVKEALDLLATAFKEQSPRSSKLLLTESFLIHVCKKLGFRV